MVGIYVDENVPIAITEGLRRRGIDVVTAQDDERRATDDSVLLDRATEIRRILFTNDDDLIVIAVARLNTGTPFCGIFYVHQEDQIVGRCIEDLETVCMITDYDVWQNQLIYLPL